jgi:hypothetical protein
MPEPLAIPDAPRENARVRLAEVVAALVDQAQKKNPSTSIADIARDAKVNRVTLQNVVSAAKSGTRRSLDEETFWNVLAVLGVGSEEALAPELRAIVKAWRAERALEATEARAPARQRPRKGAAS